MALNWEKLAKLRRDYPKPKFAFKEALKQLKKRPNDPYLLAWSIDAKLRSPESAGTSFPMPDSVDELFQRQPPITDVRLLSYLYFLRIKWEKAVNLVSPVSTGAVVLTGWQSAAKSFKNRDARLELWNALFLDAMREEVFGDAQTALSNAQKDGLQSSKSVAFTIILVSQLAIEKQTGTDTKIAKLVVLKRMEKCFKNMWLEPTNPLRVQTLGDFEFMASIYERQSKLDNLLALWEEGAAHKTHGINRVDSFFMKVDLLMKHKRYTEVKNECVTYLSAHIPTGFQTMVPSESQSLSELCHRLWGHIFAAVAGEFPTLDPKLPCNVPEAFAQVEDIAQKYLDTLGQMPGRTWMITNMGITIMLNRSVLDLCKKYWDTNHHRVKCYDDLQPFVERLNGPEVGEFRDYYKSKTDAIAPGEDTATKDVIERWLQSEVNVQKLDCLLTMSSSCLPSQEHNELIANVVRLCKIGSGHKTDAYYEAGALAIHALRRRGSATEVLYNAPCTPRSKKVDQAACNYQAALLARYLTEDEAGREHRALVLLAIDQYLRLGLTHLAFSAYPHIKVKEVLQDTLAHYLFTNISQTHPFNHDNVSPDKELQKVIQAIDKLEQNVLANLYQNMSEFKYDSAERHLKLSHTFKTSLTKHICFMERRRIARLKGEVVTELLDPVLDSFYKPSDNRDYKATSILEPPKSSQLQPAPHSVESVFLFYLDQDSVSQRVYREPLTPTFKPREQHMIEWCSKSSGSFKCHQQGHKGGEITEQSEETVVGNLSSDTKTQYWCEGQFYPVWDHLNQFLTPESWDKTTNGSECLEEVLVTFNASMEDLKACTNDVRAPNNSCEILYFECANWADPANSMLPDQEQIKIWYSLIEILQVLSKLAANLDEDWKNSKVHIKERVGKHIIAKMRKEVQHIFSQLQKCVKDWIDFLNKHGDTVLKEWARQGVVGQALVGLLSARDIHRYTSDMVSSLSDTLRGILSVKLER